MSGTTSYNNATVVTGEVEYPANDPASGAFFQPDYKKNEDLKLMLDGSKDSLKLEAMKRIIGMIAKGRDASDLFPAVVKNVVSKNIEVKKLVYVYLVRYAEEQQDLALLSISTFQRALKDPNQLIRASALRVLSSIRVTMIVPIVMLAIRDSSSDMSPYVRKTAAHAIPKLYSLDPEQKEELVAIIDKLLSDKAPLVVGSAAMAFSEVCGDRMTLIHRSYRKLCSLLADVDEWGQLALLNVLTVYAKTFFPDPNSEAYSSGSESEKPFYESDSEEGGRGRASQPSLDADHRLLLRAAKPLLQSRNSGVVMAVAQLFYHCGPVQEMPPIAKAMVRLLRAPLEVQSVVLNAIASITVTKRSLFEPFLKSFFVRNSDPTHIKLLKLEILSNLATEANAGALLREFHTYVAASDKAFAAATIHAIGRLAVAIAAETEACLNGLLQLLSSRDEWVVCEAVVVVKRVVGGGAASARAAVARAAKLLRADRLGGGARAAGVWLLAEHGAAHPRAAAVLAHMAATFADQEELVKLQLLSLAVKLSLTQPDTIPVCQYVLCLARYDASYDVRDRARLLRRFIEPREGAELPKHAATIFRPDKPKPTVMSNFKERGQFTVGSLSQYVGGAAAGYRALPAAPPTAEGAALRLPPTDLDAPAPTLRPAHNESTQKNKSFYSEPGSSGSESSSTSSSAESSDEEGDNIYDNGEKNQGEEKDTNNLRSSNSGTSASESETDSSSSDDSDSEESSSNSSAEESSSKSPDKDDKKPRPQSEPIKPPEPNEKSNLELLLELDEMASSLPTMTPTCGGFLSPQTETAPSFGDDSITPVGPSLAGAARPLLARVAAGGLQASSRFSRAPHLYSHKMCAIDILFTNHSPNDVTNIRVNKKTLTGSRSIHEFAAIPAVGPNCSASVTLGVDFADTIQPIEFTIISSLGEVPVSITPPVGELVRAVTMSETRWDAEHRKLRGMTECEEKVNLLDDEQIIKKKVFEAANVAAIGSGGNLLRFAGRMLSSQELVLVSVRSEGAMCPTSSGVVAASCGNLAVGSLLASAVAASLAAS